VHFNNLTGLCWSDLHDEIVSGSLPMHSARV